MPTKAELKQIKNAPKLKIRKGDRVMIIKGKDKGQVGYVAVVAPKEQKVLIFQENENEPDRPLPLNIAIKHRKAKFQGERSERVQIPVPLHVSKVMLLDPKSNEPTRIGRKKEDGKIVRYAKKSQTVLVDKPLIEREK